MEMQIPNHLTVNIDAIKRNHKMLCTIIKNGNIQIVQDLLKDGADVNIIDTSSLFGGQTPLYTALCWNRPDIVKLLINYGARINARTHKESNLIVRAFREKKTEIIKLLLTNGAHIKDPEVLFTAVTNGSVEVVEDLLKYGIDANTINNSDGNGYQTPIQCAVSSSHVDIAKLLINYGANVNVKDHKGDTPIVQAIRKENTKMIELLLTNGADTRDRRILDTAVMVGKLKIVEDILRDGADVNMIENSNLFGGRTPLHSAVCWNRLDIAKLLITYGVDVNVKDDDGDTPLVCAIQKKKRKMIKMLLTNGANAKDPNVLCTAVTNGCVQIVEDLLKSGANANMIDVPNWDNDSGMTPLHSAVSWNRVEVARTLIKYGAKVNVTDNKGDTPLVRAIRENNKPMIELLLTHGANVRDPKVLFTSISHGIVQLAEILMVNGIDINMTYNSIAFGGQTPLHCAVYWNQVEIVRKLIFHGVNVNIRDNKGETAIVSAIRKKNTVIIELLLANGADIKNCKILDIAVRNGSLLIFEELLKNGTDVNIIYFSSLFGDQTLLHTAVCLNRLHVAALLIHYGADVNVKDEKGDPPIVRAIREKNKVMVELLIANGADIKIPKVLCYAVTSGNADIVELLVKTNADVNMVYNSNLFGDQTPLHCAISWNQLEIAKLFINYGADVNFKVNNGITPIILAIRKENTKMIELLLANGADIRDRAILDAAVVNGCLQIVEDLLRNGTDVNMLYNPELFGDQASLYYAVCRNQVEVAKLLIKYGATVNIKDNKGDTPIVHAIRKKNTKLIELLLTNGADIKDPNVLCYAISNGSRKIVEDLLKNGADVDMPDNSNWDSAIGMSILHTAICWGQVEISELLINYGADVDIKDSDGTPPIDYAIADGNMETTMLLLNNGADIGNQVEPSLSLTTYSTRKLIKRYIAKLKAADLYVSESNWQWIANDCLIANFLKKCHAEVKLLKSEIIPNSSISFLDILTIPIIDLAKNESIVQALKTDFYKRKFPIYASMIDSRFRRGVERDELQKQVRYKFLNRLFENFPKLPFLCAEKICNYLNYRDLRKLLVACDLTN